MTEVVGIKNISITKVFCEFLVNLCLQMQKHVIQFKITSSCELLDEIYT